MQIKVSFLGLFRDQTGQQSLMIDLPAGSTYRDLLDSIASTVESEVPDWAWDSSTCSFSRRVMVSRNSETYVRDETARLDDGDEIVFFVPMGGG